MAISDLPITRITNLEFSPDSNTKYNGMYIPQLTPTEITNIPVDTSKIGGIIYADQPQELQYLAPTLQWVNISTDGGEPTFTDLTVTNNTILNNLTVTGTTSFNTLNVTDTIYGRRPGASMYNSAITGFSTSMNVFTNLSIAGTTTLAAPNHFTMPANNRLTYTGVPPVTVLVNAFFSGILSVNSTLVIGVGVNGTVQNPVSSSSFLMAAASSGSITSLLTLLTNDYIELFINTLTTAGTFSSFGAFGMTAAAV